MRRWILRVGTALLVVTVAVVGVMFAMFSSWKSRHIRDLAAGSEVVTTALGDMEYTMAGTGTPYLMIHGTPGGYDQMLAGSKVADGNTSRTAIMVSRPGYLRTPLSSGSTFEQQADLFAALLDTLKIERAVVVAASGGGYDGLQFALRHPERCVALVLLSPSVGYEPLPDGPPKPHEFLWVLQDFGLWSMGNLLARSMIPGFDPSDRLQVAQIDGALKSRIPMSARFAGQRNDLVQRIDPRIDQWPLERITVPTLIFHGTADELSDYQGSVRVASKIPNAKLITVEGGDHFIGVTRAREIREQVGRFLSTSPGEISAKH